MEDIRDKGEIKYRRDINNAVTVILVNARNKDEDALKREKINFREISNFTKGMMEEVFEKVIVAYVTEGNRKALKILDLVKENCLDGDDDLEIAAYSRTIVTCTRNNDKKALNLINDVCPKDRKIQVFAQGMYLCATVQDKEGLNKIVGVCPEGLKIQVLAEAMYFCATVQDKVALNTIGGVCSEELKIKVLPEAMYLCAADQNKEALITIGGVCPSNLANEITFEAYNICRREQNENAASIISSEAKHWLPPMNVPMNQNRHSSSNMSTKKSKPNRPGTNRKSYSR